MHVHLVFMMTNAWLSILLQQRFATPKLTSMLFRSSSFSSFPPDDTICMMNYRNGLHYVEFKHGRPILQMGYSTLVTLLAIPVFIKLDFVMKYHFFD